MTTNSLVIFVNQTYRFIVTSLDVSHGFRIISGGVNINIPAELGVNNTADATFTDLGTFQLACSVFCGSGHGTMKADISTIEETSNSNTDSTVYITIIQGSETTTETSIVTEDKTIFQTYVEHSNYTVNDIVVITETVNILSFVNMITPIMTIVFLRYMVKKLRNDCRG